MSGQGRFERHVRRKRIHILWMLLVLWLAGAVPELVLHMATAKGPTDLWNGGVLLGGLFSLVGALAVFALVTFLPWKRTRFWVGFAYCVLMLLLCGSQLVYFGVFGTFYSAFSAANGGQVLEFWYIALQSILRNLLWLIIMALPLIALLVLRKRLYHARNLSFRLLSLVPAVGAVVVQLVLVMSLAHFGGTGVGSAYDLYHHNADSYLSINRLGMATAFRLDVTRLISGRQPQGSIDLQTPTVTMPPLTKPTDPSTEPTESTGGQESTDPSQTEPSTQAPTEPTVDTSPNVLDIDFDTLIANESNAAIREVHQFFQNRVPSNKNEKTGIFEGCNLVMITAEAFSHLVVNEEWTPTLYKMMHEGFYFTDYYVPTWGASTTDGEYCFVTGTYPKSGVWSFAESADNYMPLTMSMQLIDRGYNAYAYHGHTYTYYKRNQYLSNLGYYYRGYGGSTDGKTNGLPIKYTWPESDLEVVDVSTADYVNNAPFTAYYMSISGHMNFAFNENVMSRRNRDYVKDLPYSEAVQAYIACQLEFEFSLQLLMERLEEAGQLENTVFVITADHYPYGLTDENISELLGHEVETNFELFKNACIIYKPGMTPEVIDKPCTHFDILPTLSNLFGLEFDSRLYMGRDVFSDAPGLVVFPNYSWITDYARFNARTGKVENLTDYEVTKEYTDAVMKDMTNRFAVSIRILDYDYWSILFKE